MDNVIIRFFYAPLCPEVFATLHRLENALRGQKEIVFEAHNTVKASFTSPIPFFFNEKEIIETVLNNGTVPLSYGKLFVNGEEVKGFPPAKKSLTKIIEPYRLTINDKVFSNEYKSIYFEQREHWECSIEDFQFYSYDEKFSRNVCKVCTKYNPYTNLQQYKDKEWETFELAKSEYLEQLIKSKKIVGQSAYYQKSFVGFVEAIPLDIARKHGFPTVGSSENCLYITCLSVAKEVSGKGVATKLMECLLDDAGKKGYESIQVHAHPDKLRWHPFSLYKKFDFKKLEQNDSIMLKLLT